MRGREDGASALGATGLLGSPELGQDLAPRQRGAGRGSRAARVGARHTQTGPPWSCQPGLPHALSCLPFLVSPGGGGEGQPGSSGDLVCGVSFGRRGWKRAAAGCGQIAGFPSRCLHWELVTCGWRGESPALGSPARTAPARGGGGNGAPGGLSGRPCWACVEAAGLPAAALCLGMGGHLRDWSRSMS